MWCRWKEVPKSLQVQHIFCRSNRNFRILASGGNSIIQVKLTGSVIPVSCRVWLKMGHTMHNLASRPQVLEQKLWFENFGFLLQYYRKINQRFKDIKMENNHLHRIVWTIESKLLMEPSRSIAPKQRKDWVCNGGFQEQLFNILLLLVCTLL